MMRVLRVHWRLCVGVLCLGALAGCAGHYFAQRDPWRKDAEIACLKSGSVKESGTIVRVEPINGPGICGADFPLKVATLGDSPLLSYSDGLRPPGEVPRAGPQRWPVTSEPRYAAPPPRQPMPDEPQFANPMRPAPVQRQPLYQSPATGAAPVQITPPSHGHYERALAREPQREYLRTSPPSARRPSVYDSPRSADDDEDDRPQTARHAPAAAPPRHPPPLRAMPSHTPVALGRSAVAAVGPVEITPSATLACPMVSALDRWIIDSVQPAAQRWFRQPVTGIRQISAYSCRGMNGQAGARISEHSFGNALDIASFTLADGRRVTVKDGWRGPPEEQGFLRDIQGAACEQFNTVLAPGSNRFHYDHFHVDLMRRASGHRICNPDSIPGDVVAARAARERGYAWRNESGVTGSTATSRRAALNGRPKPKVRNILAADDDDWIEDDGPRPAH